MAPSLLHPFLVSSKGKSWHQHEVSPVAQWEQSALDQSGYHGRSSLRDRSTNDESSDRNFEIIIFKRKDVCHHWQTIPNQDSVMLASGVCLIGADIQLRILMWVLYLPNGKGNRKRKTDEVVEAKGSDDAEIQFEAKSEEWIWNYESIGRRLGKLGRYVLTRCNLRKVSNY